MGAMVVASVAACVAPVDAERSDWHPRGAPDLEVRGRVEELGAGPVPHGCTEPGANRVGLFPRGPAEADGRRPLDEAAMAGASWLVLRDRDGGRWVVGWLLPDEVAPFEVGDRVSVRAYRQAKQGRSDTELVAVTRGKKRGVWVGQSDVLAELSVLAPMHRLELRTGEVDGASFPRGCGWMVPHRVVLAGKHEQAAAPYGDGASLGVWTLFNPQYLRFSAEGDCATQGDLALLAGWTP